MAATDKRKILIAEDDTNIQELLRLYLENDGFEVTSVTNGVLALDAFAKESFDLILLDIMMPYKDGLETLQDIRQKDAAVPIIMLTAKGSTYDKVSGLDSGADDYIVKPFEMKELLARIAAALRRSSIKEPDKILRFDNLEINIESYQLILNGVPTDAPPKEISLLYFLASNPNTVFTRDQLLDKVWDFEYFGDTRTVDVHIKRLREKLEGLSSQWELKTVWGVGYKFEVKKAGSN